MTINVEIRVGSTREQTDDRLKEISREVEDIESRIEHLERDRGELEIEADRLNALTFTEDDEAEEDGILVVAIRPNGEMIDILESDKSGWDWDQWRRANDRFAALAESVAKKTR